MNKSNVTAESFLQQEWFAFRSLFYMIHPNETYYKESEDVPDITSRVSEQQIGNVKLLSILSDNIYCQFEIKEILIIKTF
jgi:hypothetical protein